MTKTKSKERRKSERRRKKRPRVESVYAEMEFWVLSEEQVATAQKRLQYIRRIFRENLFYAVEHAPDEKDENWKIFGVECCLIDEKVRRPTTVPVIATDGKTAFLLGIIATEDLEQNVFMI